MKLDSAKHWVRTLPVALLVLGACAARGVSAAEAERIAEVMGIRAGMTVADVGAGDGEWSVELARQVGQSGHVYATEVDPDLLEDIEESLLDTFLGNHTVVEGSQERSGLAAGCCDAILVRMVYHHFQQPEAMRADIWQALRSGGLVGIIDIEPQAGWRELAGVPDRGGHGIPMEALIAEMSGAGFEVVSRHDDWNGDDDRYCVVFRRPIEAIAR
jgi:ubiquinone/menaquinone biosynthesis C-methylase UbiE